MRPIKQAFYYPECFIQFRRWINTVVAQNRYIGLVTYNGFELLDIAGPAAVFEAANIIVPNSYTLFVLSSSGGLIKSSIGVRVQTDRIDSKKYYHTLMISGSPDYRIPLHNKDLEKYLKQYANKCERIASICTGSFALGRAGLLDGKRSTTHWPDLETFAKEFPTTEVDYHSIYVKHDQIWSSAGMMAGIDMSLSIISEDLGHEVSDKTSDHMVNFYRRPSGVGQREKYLSIKPKDESFNDIFSWIRANLEGNLSVATLAKYSGMSIRNFTRHFSKKVGCSPAKYVEHIRVEVSTHMLLNTNYTIDRIASKVGISSTETLRKIYIRRFGCSPHQIRVKGSRNLTEVSSGRGNHRKEAGGENRKRQIMTPKRD